MSTSSLPPSSQRTELIRMYMVMICFWGSIYLFVPIMAPFAQQRGASLQTVGWLVSAYGLTQLILRIPLGIGSDRLGVRRPFIMIGFLAALIGTWGMGFIADPTSMIIFRGLTGVCASMWVMLSVWYASRFDTAHTARAMGLAMLVTNSTQTLSSLSGGFLAEHFGWEAPFLAAGVLALVGFWLTRSLREEPISDTGPPQINELLQIGKERTLLTVALLAALMQCLPFMTVYGFTSVYAVDLGATKAQLGFLTFAAGIPNAAFAYLSGSLFVPRFGARRVVLTGFSLASVSVLFFPVASSVAMLTLLQVLVSVSMGLVFPTLMALSIQHISAERRATAMGFFQSLYSLGMFGGPVLGGFLGQTYGLQSIFVGAGIVALIGAIGTFIYLRDSEPEQIGHIPKTANHTAQS